MSALHPKKIGLLHVAKKQLALEDADYRAVLLRMAGVESAADLTDAGFDLVMYEFARLGFKSTGSARSYGERPGFASGAQVAMVRRLWREYHGSDDDAALNAWLNRFHHISALRFVTSEKVQKIIPALKAMAARRSA